MADACSGSNISFLRMDPGISSASKNSVKMVFVLVSKLRRLTVVFFFGILTARRPKKNKNNRVAERI